MAREKRIAGEAALPSVAAAAPAPAAPAALALALALATVFRLPPYAHEFNPVEPVWAHLKRSLANLTKHTLADLTALVKIRLTAVC